MQANFERHDTRSTKSRKDFHLLYLLRVLSAFVFKILNGHVRERRHVRKSLPPPGELFYHEGTKGTKFKRSFLTADGRRYKFHLLRVFAFAVQKTRAV